MTFNYDLFANCLQMFKGKDFCEIEKLSVMSTTLSIILDTRRIKKSNKHPIKLRVTFEQVTEYYQTIFDLTKDEYDKLSALRISNELQTIRDKLKEIERTAENTVSDLGSFSFTDFENKFIYTNAILFRPRKLKPIIPCINTSEFDYTSFRICPKAYFI